MTDEPPDLPKVSPEVLAWVRANCPEIGIYGDSGQGKTRFAGTLFHRAEYWPVRYIEGDDGASTIAAFAGNPDICQYRNYSEHRKPGQDDFNWYLREIADAKTAECGSIIIEGFSRFYQAAINLALASNPNASGNALRKLYIPAANRLAAMTGAMQEIKRYRKQHNTGVPLTFTVNVKEQTFTDSDKKEHKRLLPAVSPNKARILMEGCDVFAQITYDMHGGKLHGDPDPQGYNNFRKVRNEGLAVLLRTKKDPDLPWLLDAWFHAEADQRANATPVIEQLLAQFRQSQSQTTETPDTQDETT